MVWCVVIFLLCEHTLDATVTITLNCTKNNGAKKQFRTLQDLNLRGITHRISSAAP